MPQPQPQRNSYLIGIHACVGHYGTPPGTTTAAAVWGCVGDGREKAPFVGGGGRSLGGAPLRSQTACVCVPSAQPLLTPHPTTTPEQDRPLPTRADLNPTPCPLMGTPPHAARQIHRRCSHVTPAAGSRKPPVQQNPRPQAQPEQTDTSWHGVTQAAIEPGVTASQPHAHTQPAPASAGAA